MAAGPLLYAGYEWQDKRQLFAEIRRAQDRRPTKDANMEELVQAVETGDAQLLAQQLVYGTKPVRLGGAVKNKRTLLMDAVEKAKGDGGEADKVVELLMQADHELVNKVDSEGNTALHLVPAGNWAVASMLEDAGARRVRNIDGQMPARNPNTKTKIAPEEAPAASGPSTRRRKQPQTELAHVGGELIIKGLGGNEEEIKQVIQSSLTATLQQAGIPDVQQRQIKIKSYYEQRNGAIAVKYEVAMDEPQEMAESLMAKFQKEINLNPQPFYGAIKRHAKQNGLGEQAQLTLIRSKQLSATQVERTTVGPKRRHRRGEDMQDPAAIDRRRVGPGGRGARRRLADEDDDGNLDPNAPTREGHVKKAVVGPGRRRRPGGRGSRGRGARGGIRDEEDYEPETTVVKAKIGPGGRRKRGTRGRGRRGRGRGAETDEGDGDVSVSKARIGPSGRRRRGGPQTTNVSKNRIGPSRGRRGARPMRDGARANARRVRKTGKLRTDVPIVSGVISFSGLTIAELKQPELESAIKYALADGPHKLNVKVSEEEDIVFVNPKADKNDALHLGFKVALPGVSDQAMAEKIRNQIKNLVSRANGRSFVNSVKRHSGEPSVSSKAISVSCVGEIKVIMPNAPLVNIASADVSKVSVLAGKPNRADVAAKVGGAVILKGLTEDVSKKTLLNAFKGTMADIPYELGFHTSPNDVQILKEEMKGDKMHVDFEILLGKEDVTGQDNLDELVSELNGAVGKHGGREMISALKRKNQELGDGSLDKANLTLTVIKELQATMTGEGAAAAAANPTSATSTGQITTIGLLSSLVKAKNKFSSLFKTMKGSVNLKGVKAEEFDASASMHKALKDALMTILMNLGLSRQNARIKLMDAKNVSANKITVAYRIRLRSDAKDLAEAVLQALKKTFSEKSSRTEFLEGFWKTHRTMDSRLKRRMQRQERRRLGTRDVAKGQQVKDEETEQAAHVAKTRQVGPTANSRRRRAKGRGDAVRRERSARQDPNEEASVAVDKSRVGPAGRSRRRGGRGRGARSSPDIETDGAAAADSSRTRSRGRGRGARGVQDIEGQSENVTVPVEKARVGPGRRARGGRGRARRQSARPNEETAGGAQRAGPAGRAARRRGASVVDAEAGVVSEAAPRVGPRAGRGAGRAARRRRVVAEEGGDGDGTSAVDIERRVGPSRNRSRRAGNDRATRRRRAPGADVGAF